MRTKNRKAKYAPAKQTIGELPRVRVWNLGGLSTAVPCIVSKRYPVTRLRGASVNIIGPDSWDNAKLIGCELVVKNKAVTVRLSRLREGVTSKIWKPDVSTFVVKLKDLKRAF